MEECAWYNQKNDCKENYQNNDTGIVFKYMQGEGNTTSFYRKMNEESFKIIQKDLLQLLPKSLQLEYKGYGTLNEFNRALYSLIENACANTFGAGEGNSDYVKYILEGGYIGFKNGSEIEMVTINKGKEVVFMRGIKGFLSIFSIEIIGGIVGVKELY